MEQPAAEPAKKPPVVLDTATATQEELEVLYQQFFPIADLGKVGFDSEIIDAMVKYEIFPQVFFFSEDPDKVPHVRAADIFGTVVNRLLHNEMELYRAVNTSHDTADKLRAEILAGAVKLSPEDLERAGTVGIATVITEKLAEKETPHADSI
jgi:hypothetical protein